MWGNLIKWDRQWKRLTHSAVQHKGEDASGKCLNYLVCNFDFSEEALSNSNEWMGNLVR